MHTYKCCVTTKMFFHHRRHTSYHGRLPPLIICRATKSTRIRDNLVFLKDLTIVEIVENGPPLKGYRVLVTPFQVDIGFPLPWDCALVWTYEGMDFAQKITVDPDNVSGKVLNCNGVLSGWMREWIQSKRAD